MDATTNLGFVFIAGIAAAFNPCGMAMLPSYVSYLVGQDQMHSSSYIRSGLRGALVGLWMTIGFLMVFLLLGLVITFAGQVLYTIMPWLSVGIGLLLVIMGLFMLNGRSIELNMMKYTGSNKVQVGSVWSMFIYGILYAAASLGCTLPVFLMLVSQSIILGEFAQGVLHFVLYALGMGLVVVTVSILALVSRTFLASRLSKMVPFVARASAIIIIGAGLYVMYYWLIGHHLL
ncbi:cytochrome c biogenesis CcdA family protein [Aneurinibacillus sp. Ricciae_BoGa-3]|uniref:cytochrome c biogenesis CcdA family protein n=1 Tax=Aneurinibacillus sp. Ricciae_BoGa-3 TaxID=3022697 RepID=UPI002342347F|nr:cytochrome c biogenesis CcdA family protein [Aneurinibacillus sp. Ricciae_BoGa-3]WCK52984.1 cytochrome c biogenesis CcdA family protein [Aneurinibacillus sp. Ricciae_BoGa-3]